MGLPGWRLHVLVNDYFITCHDDAKRIPAWVTFHLTDVNLSGETERSDDFRTDPNLPKEARAELTDYLNSGYDRGHMAPAAAFKRSEAAMSQTFLLSNMAPQTASLNRDLWRLLEEDVRELASAVGSIWVFTGSLFLDENGSHIEPATFIGTNQVAVPTHFYKVMFAANDGADFEMFAFVAANQTEALEGAPAEYLVSVDLVEALSGLDFFTALADSVEAVLEAEIGAGGPWRRGETP